ncbi:CehA/McbA family metallohydrolase [Tautonia plasticadhaerens]|uniref:DUF3604 domain-containing protein n=1 Tax=Tautonia plasticadhaerens TaxID=2527974 RepID=A0A518H506_9BACT|nr:CehA/McbA family metallohydrolase [Tautonia plasticadhaerens]QDV35925.1 hypothetical protein ElP_38340 [Tautonia plasticadhaerens]
MLRLLLILPPAVLALPGPEGASTYRVDRTRLDDPGARPRIVVRVEDDRSTADSPLPLPVRAIVTAEDGSHPDGSGRGTYDDGRFFAEGGFTVEVPPGETTLSLRSGPNYAPLEFEVDAEPGTQSEVFARLHRWFAPEDLGWFGGDNHVHAQHDSSAAVATDLAYTALQARANGLSFVTEAGSNVDYSDLDRLSTGGFLLRYAPELRPGPFVGHLNTPGLTPPFPAGELARLIDRPLPAQAIVDAVHDRGGAVIHTHPMTPPHQVHWMGAAEFLSDAASGHTADALDLDGQAAELLWSAALNLGNRVAASGSTDSALGRTRTPSPGDRRVYVRADRLDLPAISASIRAGRTFASNGGPVFAFLAVDGRGPGERLPVGPAPREIRAEVRSLNPLRSVRLIRRGVEVESFDVAGRSGTVVIEATALDGPSPPCWYALRAEDDRGHWAMTSPVHVGPRVEPGAIDASAMVLQVANATRFIELRRAFFAHLIVTVDPGDRLESVELLRDGEVLRRFSPEDGDERFEGKVPVTEIDGEYGPGWSWFPSAAAPHHFQADWPVASPGWYGLRATTADGRVLRSDELRFDGPTGASRATSVAHLDGPGTRFVHHGHGEEMPLESIALPFEGDHWWYPDRTFWRVRATFDGQARSVGGGPNPDARGLFRPPAD